LAPGAPICGSSAECRADRCSYGRSRHTPRQLTDANYLLCSPALGAENPNSIDKTEKEKLPREALIERLKRSFQYCDKAYAALTDGNIGDTVTLMNDKRPRLAVLWSHISHAFEHYGNLVTYLRLKGIVPPSSETSPR